MADHPHSVGVYRAGISRPLHLAGAIHLVDYFNRLWRLFTVFRNINGYYFIARREIKRAVKQLRGWGNTGGYQLHFIL
jgi:hypothetical protein